MPSIEIRPFLRSDRAQLAALVNAHVEVVLPGVSPSVNAIMSDERVGAGYRDAAELRWLLCWPDRLTAGEQLLGAVLQQAAGWAAARLHADGSLPVPGVYGVPDCWPHVRHLYEHGGFTPKDEEIVLLADVAALPRPGEPPLDGLVVRRALGDAGVVFATSREGEAAGLIELQGDLTQGGTLSRLTGWAELWNLDVEEPFRRRGVGTWLVGHAAAWLRLARVERVLDVCGTDDDAYRAFATACGWRELTRTTRGWERR